MASSPAGPLLNWYDAHRRDLPWRFTRDPYRIWLSEIMLQQTRAETVRAYYSRFLDLFPTVEALAGAPQEQVLKAWEGLGYYSRARNLHRAAQAVVQEHGGRFPDSVEGLLKLPGVGPYTAGAIASIAFGRPAPAVDGNVYRVASRYFGVRRDIGDPAAQREIRALVQAALPQDRPGDFNQAVMDLGSALCIPLRPRCDQCPLSDSCDAYAEGDADVLPIHEKKSPPRRVEVAVCLAVWEGRVLVMPRAQRMLGGLYVFWLATDVSDAQTARETLEEAGFPCRFVESLGEARHVFTHRVWEMHLMHFALTGAPDAQAMERLGARMAALEDLDALPFPTAMRAALEAAQGLLRRR